MTISVEQIFKEIFYNIPIVDNMIEARQILFIGKVVQDTFSGRPAKMMLTASCNHSKPEQVGRRQYKNKDTLVNNLCLLFKKLHEVHIYPQNGILKDWINEASDDRYWNQLILCILQPSTELPSRPETWKRQRQSSRNRTQTNNAPPPAPPPLLTREPPNSSPPP